MTPAELRAFAKQNNWQEDFERFDDATLGGWLKNYWDEGAQKFRSGRAGVTGFWEKPTECPPGMVPFGPSETAKCVSEAEASAASGGGNAAGTASPLEVGAEGFRMSDLIGSMVWNRVRSVSSQGQKQFGIPDLNAAFKGRTNAQRPIFDIGGGQQGMMTKGGGMAWGFVDPSWGG